jgi:mono/diheme cytochrome c family protein
MQPKLWQNTRDLAVVTAMLVLFTGPAAAEDGRTRAGVFNDGLQEFQENCVACHGADATGTGELANKLIKPPKDLTTIAKANGGEFPFWRVFDIIAGDKPVPGHETTQMPLYSQRMRSQESSGQFPPPHVRVLELTHYLESIQKK